jgi:hypothetical protein
MDAFVDLDITYLWNGIEPVLTVTLGAAFGRVLTAREVALVEVIAGFGALVLLQWLPDGRTPCRRCDITP